MFRVSVASHKGGAGKTAVATNLGGALVESGRKTLIVDVDPQGAAGAVLGVEWPEKPTTYEVLIGSASVNDAIRPTEVDGLSVLPADIDLSGAEVELPRSAGWQQRLSERLEDVTGFDVVVIDTAPGLGVLPYLALSAAQMVLVVSPADYLGWRALPTVLDAIETAGVGLIGLVPTMTGERTRHEADIIAEFGKDPRAKVLTSIPRRVAVKDAAMAGQPVTVFDPASAASKAFTELAKEVLSYG